jgi:hypothetical protein
MVDENMFSLVFFMDRQDLWIRTELEIESDSLWQVLSSFHDFMQIPNSDSKFLMT